MQVINTLVLSMSNLDCYTPVVVNAETPETPKGTNYGQLAILTCEAGYTMTGNSFVTCQDDGTWSTLPSCDIIGNVYSLLRRLFQCSMISVLSYVYEY